MKKKLVLLVLSSFLTLASCQSNLEVTQETLETGAYEALSYPDIGGKNYENFKISSKLPKSKEERKATKLSYFVTDDEGHQSPWSGKMLLFMDDLPQKNVHNVVFRDGGKVGDSILYYLQGGKDPKEVEASQSFLADNITEVQSNNPRVFSKVIEHTFDNYSGKKKYLQIYTHGGGVFGIGMDAHQTDISGKTLANEELIEMMTPPKFAEALKQGLKGRKLDLIYFRACLMSNIEALYELRDIVKYALASEDVSYSVENSNITMTKLFDDLASKDLDPKEVAYQMAIQGHGKTGSKEGYTTFSAIDISKLDELKTNINKLSLALIEALKTEPKNVLLAYDSVPTIQGEGTPEKSSQNMRDLWRFTAELDKRVTSKSVKEALALVRASQEKATIHEKDVFGASANGLSIFMPFRENLQSDKGMYKFLNGGYLKRRFAQDSAWTNFLRALPSK